MIKTKKSDQLKLYELDKFNILTISPKYQNISKIRILSYKPLPIFQLSFSPWIFISKKYTDIVVSSFFYWEFWFVYASDKTTIIIGHFNLWFYL